MEYNPRRCKLCEMPLKFSYTLCRECAQKWASTASPPYFPKETAEFFSSLGQSRISYDELVERLVLNLLRGREAEVRALLRTLPQPIWEEMEPEVKGPFG